MDAGRVIEVFGGAVLGGVVALLGQLLLSRIIERQHRGRLIFQQEQERIADLKAKAGYVTDTVVVTSYGTWAKSEQVFNESLNTLLQLKGYFLYHPDLHTAIHKLVDSAAAILEQCKFGEKVETEMKQKCRDELRANYKALVKACDDYLRRLRI